MIESSIAKTNLIPGSHPNSAGFAIKRSDGRLYLKRGNTEQENIPAVRYKLITGALTLTAADDGAFIVLASTTTRVITLPATAPNLRFTIYLKTVATSGAGHSISPAAVDKIYAKGITAVDDKDLINTQATGASGDMVVLTGDGVDGYYASLTGIWAAEA